MCALGVIGLGPEMPQIKVCPFLDPDKTNIRKYTAIKKSSEGFSPQGGAVEIAETLP